ncbi:hypothetical protein [Tenacibaculum sp. MAR_2009_124]|uniref:hypothetical protein n=1 Tax=Tenacibaculum sp. MAR_2009_124 TaxID=1250059 RepID=UPI00159FBC19|nr:hypothetical protein [Tenacibaculum sp. MAR_2009_124]
MAKKSISLTEPDDESLKAQIDWIRAKLEKAENRGLTKDSKADILNQSRSLFNG